MNIDASRSGKKQCKDENTWIFEVKHDSFGDECMLDLRSFNEKTAGEKGWKTHIIQ